MPILTTARQRNHERLLFSIQFRDTAGTWFVFQRRFKTCGGQLTYPPLISRWLGELDIRLESEIYRREALHHDYKVVKKRQIAGSTFLRHFCGSRGQPEIEVTKTTRFYLDVN
jgi:hypothetical protein